MCVCVFDGSTAVSRTRCDYALYGNTACTQSFTTHTDALHPREQTNCTPGCLPKLHVFFFSHAPAFKAEAEMEERLEERLDVELAKAQATFQAQLGRSVGRSASQSFD